MSHDDFIEKNPRVSECNVTHYGQVIMSLRCTFVAYSQATYRLEPMLVFVAPSFTPAIVVWR